jgi:hypothetical protein
VYRWGSVTNVDLATGSSNFGVASVGPGGAAAPKRIRGIERKRPFAHPIVTLPVGLAPGLASRGGGIGGRSGVRQTAHPRPHCLPAAMVPVMVATVFVVPIRFAPIDMVISPGIDHHPGYPHVHFGLRGRSKSGAGDAESHTGDK